MTRQIFWSISNEERQWYDLYLTNSIHITNVQTIRPKKKMCVYCHMSKKSRVGRSALIFFFYYQQSGNSRSGIRFQYFIFEISGKPSFIEAVLWRIMQFFYLCSQFRQKASSWINKTLLLVKQQKWLSEFCVKIHRVASNRSGDRKHTYFFFLSNSYVRFCWVAVKNPTNPNELFYWYKFHNSIRGSGWLNNSYKPITNTAWVRIRLCKLQKRVHSTGSHKW